MNDFTLQCPIPIKEYPQVLLAHGGGGSLMQQLIEKMFKSAFRNDLLDGGHDSACLDLPSGRLAMTTDSYVISPLFFPGGDIGSLAIHGTVNDLAMAGARPLYLSAGFILEEGLPMDTLWRIVSSMAAAAQAAGVRIVTGDTKVVDRGKGDGVFINTAGIGVREHETAISPQMIRAGDAILVSGDVGRHGIAIMAVREGLEFETEIESDSAPIAEPALSLLDAGVNVHCMRDVTRGGLASVLNELAQSSGQGILIDEAAVPVREDVKGACEILGFDPLYVACEGRFAAFVSAADADRALEVMRRHSLGEGAAIIGRVRADNPGRVVMKSRLGTSRIVSMLSGEQLPRIC
jgi:hydrogenase expression/formation protein HypE